jgi:hypothetical protein
MPAKWTNYYKIVSPEIQKTKVVNNQDMGDGGVFNSQSWYNRSVHGSPNRIQGYQEYEHMANDTDVARALDIIAEEMLGNTYNSSERLLIDLIGEGETQLPSYDVQTLKIALSRWSEMQDLSIRLFPIARNLVKLGDVIFYAENPHSKWEPRRMRDVVAAVVDKNNINNIVQWQIKKDPKKVKTDNINYNVGSMGMNDTDDTEIVDASNIIRFTLNDDMSDSAPFGDSILRPSYKAFKQKELLEDAIVIYRIQRAPERRAFFIDVGKMPAALIKGYLERIKNEIKQKKVPTMSGGKSQIDSVYNPMSMTEDYFFAQRPDGRGNKVEVLPGGQGLGVLDDLEYFEKKILRGLRVPISYMLDQSEGGAIFNDGRVSQTYVTEMRFSLFINRLKLHLEIPLDQEFKRYLKASNINIDTTLFRVCLPEPSNFGVYRAQELNAALLSSLGTSDGISSLAKRFQLKKFLQLSNEEIIENERMKLEEMGYDPEKVKKIPYKLIYGMAEDEGMSAGGGDAMFGDAGFGGDTGGAEGEEETPA